jgi:hypothetical protein
MEYVPGFAKTVGTDALSVLRTRGAVDEVYVTVPGMTTLLL